MSKRKKNRVARKRELESLGWNLKSEERDSVNCHTGTETALHYHIKAEIARQANNAKSSVWTEVSNERGVADVVLLRENKHPKSLVIEVESNLTEDRKKEKRETFMGPMIQEVLVWTPSEFSANIFSMQEEINSKLTGFL